MQFTPQQLAGGHKYSAKTKVGNWYEDALLEEAKYADFQRTYASGTLALRKQEEKKARCLKHVSAPASRLKGKCGIAAECSLGAMCDTTAGPSHILRGWLRAFWKLPRAPASNGA
jgi:hypothetical protein